MLSIHAFTMHVWGLASSSCHNISLVTRSREERDSISQISRIKTITSRVLCWDLAGACTRDGTRGARGAGLTLWARRPLSSRVSLFSMSADGSLAVVVVLLLLSTLGVRLQAGGLDTRGPAACRQQQQRHTWQEPRPGPAAPSARHAAHTHYLVPRVGGHYPQLLCGASIILSLLISYILVRSSPAFQQHRFDTVQGLMDIPSTVNCSLFLISIESSPDKIKSYDIICGPLLRPVSVSPCGRSRPRQWRVSATVSCCQLRAAAPLAASPGTTAPVPTSPGLGETRRRTI